MSPFELSDSVGSGGENRPADVRALTERLVGLGYTWVPVTEDVTDELETAINLVQSIKAGRDQVRGDGRVDVPGPTYDWLRATNAPRWQVMPAGSPAAGFQNVELADVLDHHDFGTSWMATTITEAGIWYRDRYLQTTPEAARIGINDVSLPTGGHTDDHSGHQTGMACDVRLPRTDGTTPGNTTFEHQAYDRDAMRAMLRAIRHQPRVTTILFNDPDLIAEDLCRRAPNHDNHVHFEIDALLPIVGYDRPIADRLRRAIERFDGQPREPSLYDLSREGFQSYLDDVGVEHFSAAEFLVPHHEDVAAGQGYEVFIPPHAWWPRGGALGCLADDLRERVDAPVTLRNWWRPIPYNDAVDGAPESDHVVAHALDLDYRSADDRRVAEERLRNLAETDEWLQLSLGFGNRSTHVGLLSPGRGRDWLYDSYVP
ncbi:D-Ala-D-Ala carboxypeptidase family metallohydrolase [Haloarcula salina]|uniref:D-Ala-D-Ala carboxypeptidase family metallohydrolase n=1 Tax=Haloarcula salina TaxID=1429914 RepID=UPI003C6F5E37